MAGHMGNERRTAQNLEVVRVDAERNLLLVRGAVPGGPGADVIVRPAGEGLRSTAEGDADESRYVAATGEAAVSVSDAVFGRDYNEPLVHQVVTAYLAGGRAGTKAQKTRAEVRGGGKKPWRQKGTGRARAGTTRSPLWRGGGRHLCGASAEPRRRR